MQKFDRQKQKILLEKMYELSPDGVNIKNISEYTEMVSIFKSDDILVDEACRIFKSNVMYLEQHGLLESYYENEQINAVFRWNPEKLSKVRITSKGIDFLEADGGLGAILGIKTVKIHNETLEKFVEIIQNSDLKQEEKQKILSIVKEKGIEFTVGKLVDAIANNGGQLVSSALKLLITSA